MAHIAFIAPPFSGHLGPLRAVADALITLGHRASFVGMADAAGMVGGAAGFLGVGAGSHPPGTLPRIAARIGGLAPGALGLVGMRGVLRDLAGMTEMLCAEAPEVLRRSGVDLVVADQTEAAGGLVARHLRLPLVSVANALPINEEARVPPPFTDWAYDASVAGQRRNEAGYRISRALSGPLNGVIARRALGWGLKGIGTMADCLSDRTQISQMVAALDFPRAALPAGFAYVGPLRQKGAGGGGIAVDGPFAYATLGTLQGGRAALFAAIAAACRQSALTCVIAHGGGLSADAIAALPGAPIVRDWVDQPAVLRGAAVAVCHGGMNTVLDALAAGVPLIVVPLAFEQAAIGARVAHHGVGLVVPPRRDPAAMAGAVRVALLAIGGDAAYAARAAAMARQIAASGGAGAAAAIIDAALGHPM